MQAALSSFLSPSTREVTLLSGVLAFFPPLERMTLPRKIPQHLLHLRGLALRRRGGSGGVNHVYHAPATPSCPSREPQALRSLPFQMLLLPESTGLGGLAVAVGMVSVMPAASLDGWLPLCNFRPQTFPIPTSGCPQSSYMMVIKRSCWRPYSVTRTGNLTRQPDQVNFRKDTVSYLSFSPFLKFLYLMFRDSGNYQGRRPF